MRRFGEVVGVVMAVTVVSGVAWAWVMGLILLTRFALR